MYYPPLSLNLPTHTPPPCRTPRPLSPAYLYAVGKVRAHSVLGRHGLWHHVRALVVGNDNLQAAHTGLHQKLGREGEEAGHILLHRAGREQHSTAHTRL